MKYESIMRWHNKQLYYIAFGLAATAAMAMVLKLYSRRHSMHTILAQIIAGL